jgi:hypothetical protein
MTTQIIYVVKSKLCIEFDCGVVSEINRATVANRRSANTRVVDLSVTETPRSYVEKDTLYLCQADLFDFMGYLQQTMPNSTAKQFAREMDSHFPGNAILFESVVKGICFATGFPALRPVQGDEGYFRDCALASDPITFARLRAAWLE